MASHLPIEIRNRILDNPKNPCEQLHHRPLEEGKLTSRYIRGFSM